MTEQDKEIQLLRKRLEIVSEENDALMGELYAIHECITCVYQDEAQKYCDEYMFGRMCRDKEYKWRGVEEAVKWQQEQNNMKAAEQRLKAMADAEEDKFTKGV